MEAIKSYFDNAQQELTVFCKDLYAKQDLSAKQIYSDFEHQIVICIRSEEFPEWIDRSEHGTSWTTMSLELQPNLYDNYFSITLCFYCQLDPESFVNDFTVKTSASNFLRSKTRLTVYDSCMVIVPSSIFSTRDGDRRIELTTDVDAEISGLHLLYKTENCRK